MAGEQEEAVDRSVGGSSRAMNGVVDGTMTMDEARVKARQRRDARMRERDESGEASRASAAFVAGRSVARRAAFPGTSGLMRKN